MNEEQLREKIQDTLLIPQDQKQKILSAKWDEKLIKQLNDFFDDFAQEEEKTLEVIHANMPNIILKTIYKIEGKYNKEVEVPQIKQIEDEIQKV